MTERRPQLLIPPAMDDSLLLIVEESRVITPMLLLWTPPAEIWDRFPLWGLAWRLAYQSLPLTNNDHFKQHWKQFIAGEVVPVIKSHAGDLLRATKETARDTLRNPRVYSTFHDALVRQILDGGGGQNRADVKPPVQGAEDATGDAPPRRD